MHLNVWLKWVLKLISNVTCWDTGQILRSFSVTRWATGEICRAFSVTSFRFAWRWIHECASWIRKRAGKEKARLWLRSSALVPQMRMDLLLCRSKQRNALHAIHRLILYIERMRRSESLDANARRVSGPVTCKISALLQTLTRLVLIGWSTAF